MRTRYLTVLFATMLATLAAVWLWVAAMPLAYLDPEYPAWLAKQRMLESCDLGDIVVVGDLRAAVAVMPAMLPVKATNLAVGGGTPVEAYVALAHALACRSPPRRVIVSLDAAHFTEPDLFWERSVRFGFVDAEELTDLRQVSRQLSDPSIYYVQRADGLPAPVRSVLYAVRFPSLYFNSLAKGGVFLRWWNNREALAASLATRGQYFFGTDDGSSVVAAEGHLRSFVPLPVLDHYFDRMLALLAAHNIPVDFVAIPMNQSTWQAVRPEVRTMFTAYVAAHAASYANFRVVGEVMPHWPDHWFGDGYSHLNPAGARRFSSELARRLESEGLSPTARRSAEYAERRAIGVVQ